MKNRWSIDRRAGACAMPHNSFFISIRGLAQEPAPRTIKRPSVLLLFVLGVVLCAHAADRPNILLILADDLGQGDLSVNNPDSKIPTPHLDQLAAEGMNFLDAHSPSGVCTPTRYGVLTGRYAWRSSLKRGVLTGGSPPLIEKGRLTIPAMLQAFGYASASVGKWHLGEQWSLKDPSGKQEPENIDWTVPAAYCALDAGFTYYFGLSRPGWGFMENRMAQIEPTEPFDLTHIPSKIIGGNNDSGFRAPGFTFEQMIPAWVEKTKAFIQRNAESDTPFFAYFAPICPHRPINPNQQFYGKSECGVFGDFVVELDHAVGELLAALEENGVGDDTLVIFTADNGAETNTYDHIQDYGHWSSNGRRGAKRDLYEGGHRVPFITRWRERIPAGSQSDEIICLTDIMATVADIVDYGLPAGSAEDSYSILPVLEGKELSERVREATVHHSARGNFAIRMGDWVFIDGPNGADNAEPEPVLVALGVNADDEPAELYNLREDPKQTTNVFRKNPEKSAALKELLDKYRTQPSSLPTPR
jgi:arylsulfatase A